MAILGQNHVSKVMYMDMAASFMANATSPPDSSCAMILKGT